MVKPPGTSRGFTLAEVLVSLMVLCMVASAMGPTLLSGKLLLRKGFERAEAVQVATMRMEQNLVKSYSTLVSSQGTDCIGSTGYIDTRSRSECAARAGRSYDWRANVTSRTSGVTPYKELQVQVSYLEGNELPQTVTLTNYIPYPFIHIVSRQIPQNRANRPGTNYSPLYAFNIDFATRKSVQLSYNVAIRVEDPTGIQPLDTLYTMARIMRGGNLVAVFFPETRTPIRTQPLINNWAQVDNLDLRGCRLEIFWRKERPAGAVSVKMGNVILIAVEQRT